MSYLSKLLLTGFGISKDYINENFYDYSVLVAVCIYILLTWEMKELNLKETHLQHDI